jgi:hypothetical protein
MKKIKIIMQKNKINKKMFKSNQNCVNLTLSRERTEKIIKK